MKLARHCASMLSSSSASIKMSFSRMLTSINPSVRRSTLLSGTLCSPSPLPPFPSASAVLRQQQDRAYRPSLHASAATSRLPSITSLSDSETAHWDEILSKITKPQLSAMKGVINPGVPMGLDTEYLRGVNRKVQLHDYFLKLKRAYPTSVVLVQIGSFYEASGIDALVLAQFANMNLMGQKNAVIPKAGFPLDQLPVHVFTLNQEGFSVVVATEVSKAVKTVNRKVDFVSTPARPRYFEPTLADAEGVSLLPPRPVPPMLGIASSKHGLTLYTMHRDTMLASSMGGLTKEGLFCKMYAAGYSTPVLLHDSINFDPQLRNDIVGFIQRTASVQLALTASFTGQDPDQGFINKVKQNMFAEELQEGRDVAINMVPVQDDGRPRPPYLSTIMQLGLGKQPMGIPSLLDALGGAAMPALSRHWMHSLLLMPPAHEHALLLQKAVAHYCTCDQARPLLAVSLTATKIVETIESRRTKAEFFWQLNELIIPVVNYLESQAYKPVVEALAKFCLEETGLGVHAHNQHLGTVDGLRIALQAALQEIQAVVVDSVDDGTSETSKDGEAPGRALLSKQQLMSLSQENLRRLREANEGFRDQVKAAQMQQEVNMVDQTFWEFQQESLQLVEFLFDAEKAGKAQPYVSYRKIDKTSAVMSPGKSPSTMGGQKLAGAKDRKGDSIAGSCTTSSLQAASDAYFAATQLATIKATELMSSLCATLSPQLSALIMASHMAVVMEALSVHAELKRAHGWCLPELLPPQEHPTSPAQTTNRATVSSSNQSSSIGSTGLGSSGPTASSMSMVLKDLRPYYLAPTDRAVTNDVELGNNLWLLTGANMGGKSTVLRSIAAASLLGLCGLMVPAKHARIPAFDSIMLRNFSGDSPVEGKSSFRLEMEDTRCADQESTSRSLVLADELGKGTEVDAGTAVCAALATRLAQRGSTTVFATHLHKLVDLLKPLAEEGKIVYMRMGLEQSPQGKLLPTWRVERGTCFESLAFNVAEDTGMDPELVDMMRSFYDRILARAPVPGGGVPSGSTCSSSNMDSDMYAQNSSTMDIHPLSSSSLGAAIGGSDQEEEQQRQMQQQQRASSAALWREKAVHILRETVGSSCRTTVEDCSSSSSSGSSSSSDRPLPPVWHIGSAERVSGPHARNVSVVYVVQYASGELHCGVTTSLQQRLTQHRRRQAGKPWAGPGAAMDYVLVPDNKLRILEAAATNNICEAGVPLVSLHDRIIKSFPKTSE